MFRSMSALFICFSVLIGNVDFCYADATLSDEIDLADQSLDSNDIMIRNCRVVAVRKFIAHAADTGTKFTTSTIQFEGAQRVFWKKQIELRFNALFFNSDRPVGRVTVATFASENDFNECR